MNICKQCGISENVFVYYQNKQYSTLVGVISVPWYNNYCKKCSVWVDDEIYKTLNSISRDIIFQYAFKIYNFKLYSKL